MMKPATLPKPFVLTSTSTSSFADKKNLLEKKLSLQPSPLKHASATHPAKPSSPKENGDRRTNHKSKSPITPIKLAPLIEKDPSKTVPNRSISLPDTENRLIQKSTKENHTQNGISSFNLGGDEGLISDDDSNPLEKLMKLIEDSFEMPMLNFNSCITERLDRLLQLHKNIEKARIEFICEWNQKVNDLLDRSGFSQSSLYRNVVSLVLSELNSDPKLTFKCLTNDNARALIAKYESMIEDFCCYQMPANLKEDHKSKPNDFGINSRLWEEAATNVITASQAPQKQRCEICWEDFPPNEIFGLSCCQCIICNPCMRSFFSVMIHDGYVANFVCPVCHCPDIDEDTMHFQLLEPKLNFLLSHEDFESYQQKMTEWNLMKNPNFRWCINATCNYGFLISESQIRRVVCPECKVEMCSQCKRPWETQHEGLSCERFSEWKKNNDYRFQEEGLAVQLQENGIDCPRCHRRYLVSKGGCIHFTCTYCHYEFCSACSKPFVRICKKSSSCKQSGGLHCHHPRNCLYYLRDKSVKELQRLLEENGFKYDCHSPGGVDFCPIIEEKDVDGRFIQGACKKPVLHGQAGLCEIHYKEYLAGIVSKEEIEPAPIMSENELIREIQNANVSESTNKHPKETPEQYRDRLIRVVKNRVLL